MTVNEYGVSYRNDESVLELDSGDGCITENIFKITKLYTLRVNLCYVNCISVGK